ncbi:MAG: prepilin peptidase [Gemmatimonadetes bacterium]|nr:prepilin peptidase [Gemmatimonadota bacterium]
MPRALFIGLAALVGAALGSFLNVCIHRLPQGLSVVRPGSRCPDCRTPIRWSDNVPVLSYAVLRGRCRACGARISVQYPLVELGVAAIWSGSVVSYGVRWAALSTAVFLTLLLAIAITDARTYTIPDAFSLGGLVAGLVLSLSPGGVTLRDSAFGALFGFVFLYVVAVLGEWAFKKPAMGGGDVKMMAMIGAFLGPLKALLTCFVGALVGAVIFGPVHLRTKKLVPFGVFLAVGAAVVLLWGEKLIRWYTKGLLGF